MFKACPTNHKNVYKYSLEGTDEYWYICQDCKQKVVWNITIGSFQLNEEVSDSDFLRNDYREAEELTQKQWQEQTVMVRG